MGFNESFAGFNEDSAGFGQGSANYLGSNRILRGSWPHGPPPLTVHRALGTQYTYFVKLKLYPVYISYIESML